MTRLMKGIIVGTMVRYSLLLVLSSGWWACTPGPELEVDSGAEMRGAYGAIPETEEQRILNVLGQAIAQNILRAGFSEEELAYIQRGLRDAVLGEDALVELSEYGPQIQAFMERRAAGSAEGELALANLFVEEQAGVAGAEQTESGLVIQEILAGTGASPTAGDTVRVHYHGTLRDGAVFDSSVERGEPTTFPLDGVIPCWTEGLQHIRVGGKSRLICPPNLAYGPQGPPGIPGNAALVFEIELLDIIQD